MSNYLNSCKTSAIEAFLPALQVPAKKTQSSWIYGPVATITIWRQRAAQRQALRQLNDHQLQDIGIDRATALLEANKPFWLA